MFKTLILYCKLAKVCVKSQLQYRASFLMTAFAHFISTFVDILSIWILFERFQAIEGWQLEELALIYGIIHMGFATAELLSRGFDTFSLMIKQGEFDRVLLRPISTLLQIATSDIQLMRIGRFFQGLIVLLWGCSTLHLSINLYTATILFLAFVGTTSLFYGLFVIQATLSFWTVETLELMNITTYGGLEAGQYPMSIYNRLFQGFFTFAVPLACVAYYPIATILLHETFPLWIAAVIPLSGILFLYLSCQFWKLGVRHYHSTGS